MFEGLSDLGWVGPGENTRLKIKALLCFVAAPDQQRSALAGAVLEDLRRGAFI
jgi:hypothetical protein